MSVDLWAPRDFSGVIHGLGNQLRSLWTEIENAGWQLQGQDWQLRAAWSGDAADEAQRLYAAALTLLIPPRIAFQNGFNSGVEILDKYYKLLLAVEHEIDEQRKRLSSAVEDRGELVRRSGLLADRAAQLTVIRGADEQLALAEGRVKSDNEATRYRFTLEVKALAGELSTVVGDMKDSGSGTLSDDGNESGFSVDPPALRGVAAQIDHVAGVVETAIGKTSQSGLTRPREEPLPPPFEDMLNTAYTPLRQFLTDVRKLAGGLRNAADGYEREDASAEKALQDMGG